MKFIFKKLIFKLIALRKAILVVLVIVISGVFLLTNSLLFQAQAESDLSLDSDSDGCADVEERGPLTRLGGQRDPQNPWDFFDLNGDKKVNIIDIQRVAFRSGITSEHPLYTPQYDRSVIGPNNWNLGPGDGAISAVDTEAVVAQYNHECLGGWPELVEYFTTHLDEFRAQNIPLQPSPLPIDIPVPEDNPLPPVYGSLAPSENEEPLHKFADFLFGEQYGAAVLNAAASQEDKVPEEIEPLLKEIFAGLQGTVIERGDGGTSQSESEPAGIAFICTSNANDTEVGLPPPFNFLWAASINCNDNLDQLFIATWLEYYSWSEEKWFPETFLRQVYDEDNDFLLNWGALSIPPFFGINCKRIGMYYWFKEEIPVLPDWKKEGIRHSGGECY